MSNIQKYTCWKLSYRLLGKDVLYQTVSGITEFEVNALESTKYNYDVVFYYDGVCFFLACMSFKILETERKNPQIKNWLNLYTLQLRVIYEQNLFCKKSYTRYCPYVELNLIELDL